MNREGYGELVPDTATVEWDSADDLRASIERVGPDRVAAFFCEPVMGAGGVYPPPEGYLADVRKVCTEYDVLFVADEVVTGYGRIGGSWFASSRFGLEPDMVTTAKGLTSGYLPMGAVLISPKVSEPFFRPDGGVWWRHGYTYSGHATAAAVALANLAIIEREGLLDEATRLQDTPRLARCPRWQRTSGSLRCAAASARWPPSSSRTPVRRSRWPERCARTGSPRGPSEPAASRSPRPS